MEAALVSLLAPFLPYLVRAGERAAENVADALTSEAGRFARAVWEKLFPRVESRPAAAEAAADVAASPDDELARSALQLQLRKLLDEDAGLRDEIGRMLADAERRGVVAAAGGVAVGGDVRADRGSIGVIGTVRGDVSLPRPSDED